MNTSIDNQSQANVDQAIENIKRNLAYYGRLLHAKKFRNPAFTFTDQD